jgi:hypothetical protein
MNTTKSIYNKLFKEELTELASHEVHLATLDQLLTNYISATKREKESADEYLILKTDIARAKQRISDNLLISERTIEQFNQFEKDAKALGLSLPPDVQKNLNSLKNGVSTYSKYIKNINSIKL